MFGTLVEVEGGGERRWGRLRGFGRPPIPAHHHMNLGFAGRRLRGFGASENPTWVFDDEGNVTIGDTPQSSPDYLTAFLDTLKTVAPSVLGVVQAAVNRGVQSNGNCPAGYAYYSPIVGRCFRTPGEMSAAESAVQQAQQQYGGGGSSMNGMLIAGAVGLGVLGLVLALKK